MSKLSEFSKLKEKRHHLHAMSMAEAQEELATLRRRLLELRLQLRRGEVKNNRQFSQTKTDIARLLGHLGELNRQAWLEEHGLLPAEEAERESPEAEAEPAAPVRRARASRASAPVAEPVATVRTTTAPTTSAPVAEPEAPAADEAEALEAAEPEAIEPEAVEPEAAESEATGAEDETAPESEQA